MNINFGLFRTPHMRIRDKRVRNQKIYQNAIESLARWQKSLGMPTESAA